MRLPCSQTTTAQVRNFNPRTREGCDGRENRPQEKRLGHFNPRTRKGCDQPRPPLLPRSAYFNPRTREGCDSQAGISGCCLCSISIHAPVKGATGLLPGRHVQSWGISIHAPVKGATLPALAALVVSREFQSTHP